MRLLDRPNACARGQAGLSARPRDLFWFGLAAVLVAGIVTAPVHAQSPIPGRGKNFVAPVTDAQGNKSVLRGGGFRPVANGMVELTNMQAETFRGAQKDMVVQAPQCIFDPKQNIATSAGALSIRTADERFSIAGEGFRWQLGDSRLASRLSISNRVHSLVRKRDLKPAGQSGTGAATRNVSPDPPGQPASASEFIEIDADHFEHQGDAALFRGNVRVHEIEGDLNCGVLRVIFGAETNRLQRIEAEQEVVLVQGATRVRSDRAVYVVAPDQELLEFIGHSVWQDGERQGSGDTVAFDRRSRLLRSTGNAYLRLPRRMLGQYGLDASAAQRPVQAPLPGASGFVEVFSDQVQMQLAPTNGPVQRIQAEKNVLIVDEQQNSRALADLAVYEESTGNLDLTGSPLFESERRLITGKVLRFSGRTMVFSAGPEAYVKLPLQSLTELPILASARAGSRAPAVGTNQFLEIWAKSFEYHTNRLQFLGGVRANLLEGDQAQGKLTCESLEIRYGQQVEGMSAEGAVEVEQFAARAPGRTAARRVTCQRLRATFSNAGRLQMAVAELGVSAEQEETGAGVAQPILTQMSAQTVTAWFSPNTNRLDRAVASEEVVFKRDQRTARGAQAAYNEATGLLELTGAPVASLPEGQITDAERLVWDRFHSRFIGRGKFKSEWKQPARGANALALPVADSRAK